MAIIFVFLSPFIINFIARYKTESELEKYRIQNSKIKLYNIFFEGLCPKLVYRASYTVGDRSGIEICVFNIFSTEIELFDL